MLLESFLKNNGIIWEYFPRVLLCWRSSLIPYQSYPFFKRIFSDFSMKLVPDKIVGSPAFVRVFVHQDSLLGSLWVYIFYFLILIEIDNNQDCVFASLRLQNYCFDWQGTGRWHCRLTIHKFVNRETAVLSRDCCCGENIAKMLEISFCLVNGRVWWWWFFLQDIGRTHNIWNADIIGIMVLFIS